MAINPNLNEALRGQYNQERQNAVLYEGFAVCFDFLAYPGFAEWARLQAVEERSHAHMFAEFILAYGELPRLTAMPAFGITMDASMLSVNMLFFSILSAETDNLRALEKVYFTAEREEYPAACAFLQRMLADQVESIRALNDIVQQISRAKDNEAALLILDEKLGKYQQEVIQCSK